MYETLIAVLDHISKHLEIRQKYSAARRIFNVPFSVLNSTFLRPRRLSHIEIALVSIY